MGVAPADDPVLRRTAEAEQPPPPPLSGLVVGNYCHDVLFRDGVLIGESLGGAASFISNVFGAIGCRHACRYVSKVGPDFAYAGHSLPAPLFSPSSPTTLFHAHFSSSYSSGDVAYHGDRVLKRVHACDPILPSDIPEGDGGTPPLFDFGLAVGVAGEISPRTLARMIDVCRVVFVDVQALIRTFDPIDGTVGLVPLRDTGFYHLLPRIGFLKASADEAPFVDIEQVRKSCRVVVTDGKDGCRVYSESDVLTVPPFPAVQLDPTGAGDSFLGGFVAGMVHGLTVPDAALLGNFFGSLTVGQIGVPKFPHEMLQRVKDVLGRELLIQRRDWVDNGTITLAPPLAHRTPKEEERHGGWLRALLLAEAAAVGGAPTAAVTRHAMGGEGEEDDQVAPPPPKQKASTRELLAGPATEEEDGEGRGGRHGWAGGLLPCVTEIVDRPVRDAPGAPNATGSGYYSS